MKKILGYVIIISISFYTCGNYVYKSSLGDWEIEKSNKSEIIWADFTWVNQTKNGKYFEKTAMLIPCKVEGIENDLTFQFDTGSSRTMLYENSLSSLYFKNQKLSKKIKRFAFPVNFLKSKKLFKGLTITFGNYKIYNESAFVFGNYGTKYSTEKVNNGSPIHIGTIGADIFKDKVLIIDYPNKKFAICDVVPKQYQESLIDIELSKNGKPILPLIINSSKYRILFDNGSSLFPLTASTKNIHKFSNNPILDSIEVSSWGKKHILYSRIITDTFKLAGKKFCNVKVYENHSGLGIDKKTDAMAGNFLFWDNIIVIDFKNRKFGVN